MAMDGSESSELWSRNSQEDDEHIQPPGEATDNISRPCYLLKLPAELRNKIFYLCVVETDEIEVDYTFQPPALLTTCRQIRSDAIQVWLFANHFTIKVYDCNVANLKAFCTDFVCPFEDRFKATINFIVEYSGVNWTNLIQYCRYVWENTLPKLAFNKGADELLSVLHLATNIAQRSQEQPWEAVESQLESLRVVVGHLDKNWLD